MADTVILHYSASSNISFRGELDTGISKAEWAEMSDEEQNQAIEDEVFNLIDIWAEE